MPRRSKPKPRASPGGPGAMAALRRAQEKLKALGIKPWKAPAEPAPEKRVATATAPSAARKVKAPPKRKAR